MLEFKTNGLMNLKGLPKIYFCCGSVQDFKRCFDTISEELFNVRSCSVWYKKDISEVCGSGELELMNMVVIPVTSELLTSSNDVFEKEFELIQKKHIPVLPIIFDSGLDKLYEEKFGNLQYLNRISTDVTEISYSEKLKKYLDSVLVSDETAEKVRNEFDAYIFISYRKKDRDCAHKLMKLIHNNEQCRDFATWYDEFLLPGENFNEQIQEALKKSDLFALVVTPNIVEAPNYIITHEYPAAAKLEKTVIPFEAKATERMLLEQSFSGIPECIPEMSINSLTEKLLDFIGGKTPDNTPKHIFLIGLAYMAGIDVETDKEKGLRLIKEAADSSEFFPEAIEKLVNIYEVGDGVEVSYKLAMEWQNKLISEYKKRYFKNHSEENCNLLMNALVKAAELEEKANSGPDGYERAVIKAYREIIDFLEPHNEISPSAERTAVIISSYVKMSEYEMKRNSYIHAERYAEAAISYYYKSSEFIDESLIWKEIYKAYLIRFDSKMYACDSNAYTKFCFEKERLNRMDERFTANEWLKTAEAVLKNAEPDFSPAAINLLKAEIYIRSSRFMHTIGNFEGAMLYSECAVCFLSSGMADNESLLAAAYELCGFTALLTGEHQNAIGKYYSAVDIRKKIADKNKNKEELYHRYYPEYITGCIELLVKRPDKAMEYFDSVCEIHMQLGKEYNAYTDRVYDVIMTLRGMCEKLSGCTADIDYYTSLTEAMLEYEERFINNSVSVFVDKFCCRTEITYIIFALCVKSADLNKKCGNSDTAQKLYKKAYKAFGYLENREMVSLFILNTALRCKAEAENKQYDGIQIENISGYVIENARNVISENEKLIKLYKENTSSESDVQ